MNFLRMFKIFLVSYPVFTLVDFTWYGFMISKCYHAHIGHLMRQDADLNATMFLGLFAALAIVVMGAVVFLSHHVEKVSYPQSFVWGAFYGLVIYGGYSLSNYALLRDWPIFITVLDKGWGIIAGGFLGVFISYLSKKVF